LRSGVGLAALLILAAPPAGAGPWAVGKDRVYAKLSYQHLDSTTLAQPDGTQLAIPRYRQQNADLFVAYGLSDTFTLFANLPLLRSNDLEGFESVSGFGDLRFALQGQIGRFGAWVLAGRTVVQAPTGDETAGQGVLPTGSGTWEGAAVGGIGRSVARGRGFVFVEVGYQIRGGGLRDGFLYEVQVGWNPAPRVVLAANVRGLEPYSKAPRDSPIGSPVGVSDRVTYTVYGPTLILKLGGRWSVQLDVEGAFNERNIATGTMFRGGLVYQR